MDNACKFLRNPGRKYLREEILPTIFCPGCGGGTVLNCYIHAVDDLGLAPETIVSVTGIGCSSWILSPYFKCDTLHTTHGRPIAFATGVKIMKPDMKVVIIAGDGDLAGIGGNHLIHAARRNIGLTVFLVNNYIYGMTGGQVAPTTPYGVKTSTTPHANVEYPMQIGEVMNASGANFVARWTTYHVFQLQNAMKKALTKKGFSIIEIMSQCTTSYGKHVGMRKASQFLEDFRDRSINVKKAHELNEAELENKIIVGTLVERDREEFTVNLRNLNKKACSQEQVNGD